MLRRRIPPVFATANTRILSAKRWGGLGKASFDHSGMFARALTEPEQQALAAQHHRTVSATVPGKFFMRHWIAGEQAARSITDRGLALAVSTVLIVGATFYYNTGFGGCNWMHMAGYTMLAFFIVYHTHMPQLWAVFVLPYLAAYYLW